MISLLGSAQRANPYQKMDYLFYSAIKKIKSDLKIKLIVHIIKLILTALFLVVDLWVFKTYSTLIIMFIWVAFLVISFNLTAIFSILHYAYANNTDNNKYFLSYALETGHSVQQQLIRSRFHLTDIDLCVSHTIYNAQTGALNQDQGLTSSIRSKYESLYSNYIETKTFKKFICLQFFQVGGKFGSISLYIFGLFTLFNTNSTSFQKGVVVTLLILESLNIWFFILMLLIMALSPIFFIIFLLAACCCFNRIRNEQPVSLPGEVQITSNIIEQSDGSCPICFQRFVLEEKVIVLPCSNKHIFHKSCLETWAKVAKTCPICRKNMDGSN